jgi:hypothetical protein
VGEPPMKRSTPIALAVIALFSFKTTAKAAV